MTLKPQKAALLASLGAGLEYYDFAIYGMMVTYLNTLFFAEGPLWINEVKAFAIFAVGYLARPFGGVVFGIIGDTLGRKVVFPIVMMLMAFSTFSIGLLPTYSQIGILAPCLLVMLRFFQGLSFGAELPGAITVAYEYAPRQKSGLYSSFVVASTGYGALLATLVLYILSHFLSREAVLSYGWRLPFLLGGGLAIVSYWIRRKLHETPEFVASKNSKVQALHTSPFSLLLRTKKQEVFIGVGLTIFLASLVIFALYLPAFLSLHGGFKESDVYLALMIGILWCSLILPFMGLLADHVGRFNVYFCSLLLFLCFAFPAFSFLNSCKFSSLVFFILWFETILAATMSSYFFVLSSLFSTTTRYTGIALCYNTVYALMGSAPIFMTWMIHQTGTISVCWFLLGCATLSLLVALYGMRCKVLGSNSLFLRGNAS